MDDNTYNGWTNYATWRIQLELVDDEVHYMLQNDPQYFKGKDKFEVADELKAMVEEIISDGMGEDRPMANIVKSYALAFLADVNWDELAEAAIEKAKEYQHA